MTKIVAMTLLAMAAFASSASAQGDVGFSAECAVSNKADPFYRRCHGPTAEWRRSCCDPKLKCIMKDGNYGQCRPIEKSAPSGWTGAILNYNSGGTTILNNPSPTITHGIPPATPVSTPTTHVTTPAPATPVATPAPTTPATPTSTTPVATPVTAPPPPPATTAGDVSSDEFVGIIFKDYIPSTIEPNLVNIQDIPGARKKVNTQKQCEEFCAETEDCNAASYYLDGSDFGGPNCWLKTIEGNCALPADVVDDPNATLIIKVESEACKTILETAAAAIAPPAPVSRSASATVPPLPTAPLPTVGGPVQPTTPPVTTSGATASVDPAAPTPGPTTRVLDSRPAAAVATPAPAAVSGSSNTRSSLTAIAVTAAAVALF